RTGGLQTSISYDINRGDKSAEIGPDDSYYNGRGVGRAVELGRPAGGTPPPAVALMTRYGLSLGAAKKAAQKIGRDGTKGAHFVADTYDEIKDGVEAKGMQAVIRIANKF